MARAYAKDVTPQIDGKHVELKGWVHEMRDLNKIKFLLLRDKTGIIQAIGLKGKTPEKAFELIANLPVETVISLKGTAKANKEAKKGVEVIVDEIEVLNNAEPLPITVTEKGISIGLSKRLDYRSIDLRKPENHAIFEVQAALIEGMQEYLNKDGFQQVFTPCLMGAASESGAEVFKVAYFNQQAFLRQDPQLHRQLTILGGIEKLYDIGPSWRAELSHTVKHLCEHRTCAVELAFIEDERDTMRVEEKLVISALKKVKAKCKDSLELLNAKVNVPEAPFPEIRFPEIYDILEKMGKKVSFGSDVDTECCDLLWEHVQKKYKTEFYFFNRFPYAVKPFYVMAVDDDPTWARSVDMNYKGLELSSGGQREHRYEKLIAQVKGKNMDPKSVEWFTKFFKYGAPPHGGFAIGIERLTQNLLNLDNIKRAVLFPRDPERLEP